MPAQIDTMPVDAHLAGDVIGSLLPDGELEELPPLCESHAPEPPLIAQLSTSPELASGVNTRLESYLRAAAAAAIQEGIGPDTGGARACMPLGHSTRPQAAHVRVPCVSIA